MIDYLYYKLYKVSLKSSYRSISKFVTAVNLSGLFVLNSITLSALLAKTNVLPFIFSNKYQVAGMVIILSGLISWYYHSRSADVIKKFAEETNENRIRGNIIVWIYILASFALLIAVALFKPGKL